MSRIVELTIHVNQNFKMLVLLPACAIKHHSYVQVSVLEP